MLKKFITISFLISFLLGIALKSQADFITPRRSYGLGWQISGPASGFSLKIPYQADYYLQPVFSIAMTQKGTATTNHYALGIRGIYNFLQHQDFLPYAGVSLGFSHGFEKAGDSESSESNFGYQTFFGVEYQKYLLRPALEVGIGGANKSDGSFKAGVIYNLSVLYYF